MQAVQEVLPLFNAVAKEAECTLKDTSLQDALCARSVHSLAAKIQSMQAAETIAAINLYWCRHQTLENHSVEVLTNLPAPTLHYFIIIYTMTLYVCSAEL